MNAPEKQVVDKRVLTSNGTKKPTLHFCIQLRGTVGTESVDTTKLRPISTGVDQASDSFEIPKEAARSLAIESAPAQQRTLNPKINVTMVRGEGFTIKTKMFKQDIPDVYCKVKLGDLKEWTTSTIKNNVAPAWNESKSFSLLQSNPSIPLLVQVFDANSGKFSKDDALGIIELKIGKLLMAGGSPVRFELMQKGKATGAYIYIKGELSH